MTVHFEPLHYPTFLSPDVTTLKVESTRLVYNTYCCSSIKHHGYSPTKSFPDHSCSRSWLIGTAHLCSHNPIPVLLLSTRSTLQSVTPGTLVSCGTHHEVNLRWRRILPWDFFAALVTFSDVPTVPMAQTVPPSTLWTGRFYLVCSARGAWMGVLMRKLPIFIMKIAH